jgi:hypothetical protein
MIAYKDDVKNYICENCRFSYREVAQYIKPLKPIINQSKKNSMNTPLIHCSALGKIMTEPQTKIARADGQLSQTAKTHLIEVFVSEKYGREKNIENKFIEKSMQVQESALVLYSQWCLEQNRQHFLFHKNEFTISNAFISGSPSTHTGEDIIHADTVIDIRWRWDIYSFCTAKFTEPEKDCYWQMQGYMALTGARTAKLVYALLDMPDSLVHEEWEKLRSKIIPAKAGAAPVFSKAWAKRERQLKYPDVPLNQRIFEISFERNEEDIKLIYERVKTCRKYMWAHFFMEEEEV